MQYNKTSLVGKDWKSINQIPEFWSIIQMTFKLNLKYRVNYR